MLLVHHYFAQIWTLIEGNMKNTPSNKHGRIQCQALLQRTSHTIINLSLFWPLVVNFAPHCSELRSGGEPVHRDITAGCVFVCVRAHLWPHPASLVQQMWIFKPERSRNSLNWVLVVQWIFPFNHRHRTCSVLRDWADNYMTWQGCLLRLHTTFSGSLTHTRTHTQNNYNNDVLE